ncbi:thioredoxin domain-containing protein [Candidatus Saccharibacteria bacterium]|nr:thioredoxin domain-containing protein [Candidatus Saccharibacteria bacterium]
MKKYLVPAVFTILIIGLLGFAIKASLSSSNDPKPEDTSAPKYKLSDEDKKALKQGQATGGDDAKVVITEFADFQCPACRFYETTTQELRKLYPEKLKIVYKHLPLYPQPHKNALVAAYASEAAALQGKFWPMHDILYEKQADWSEEANPKPLFLIYAQNIGLNVDQFSRDMDAEAGKDAINRDKDFAKKLELGGTPSFFINGEPFDTKTGGEALKTKIKDLIEKS